MKKPNPSHPLSPTSTSTQLIQLIALSILFAILLQNYTVPRYYKLPHLSQRLPSYLKTGWAPYPSNFLDILHEYCGWTIVDEIQNATIVWLRSGDAEVDFRALRVGRGQLYSLIEDTDCMTDKGRLHQLLLECNSTWLQPETYFLAMGRECSMFFRRVEEEAPIVWVSKEPDNSQGDGIIINPDMNVLRETWLKDPEGKSYECRKSPDPVVLQQYITNPLLLGGKKMEIRTYWTIVSLEPYIVYYHDGTVRLTTRDYTTDNWDDPLVHITNTKQQKDHNPDYYLTEHERKWTVEQLAEYLEKTNIVPDGEKWLSEELRPTLKKYIQIVATAAWPHMMRKKHHRGYDGKFELLGMDVILDSNLRPWLTEIQMGPGLSRDRGIKEHLLPRMLEELVDILLEVDHEIRHTGTITAIQSAKHWQRIPILTKAEQRSL